ncbi:MAG TPA: hypothetical protein VEP68_11740, partial [Anaeromyxobacteraceae bacterium]|nr:hypothetical protein [Anaeromyxobacteraceae bacterium]
MGTHGPSARAVPPAAPGGTVPDLAGTVAAVPAAPGRPAAGCARCAAGGWTGRPGAGTVLAAGAAG